MSKSALQVLQDIQHATHMNAAPLPTKENAEPEWQGIGFQLGGVRLVSPMGEVNELLQIPRIAALPGVKSWVLGVSNIRGQLVPIIDLHAFLGLESTMPAYHARVLLVEDSGVVAGLVVESSLGIQHFVTSSFEPPGSDVPQVLAPYVKGVYRHGGRVFYEAQLTSILNDPRFFDVASNQAPSADAEDVSPNTFSQTDLNEAQS